MAHTHNRRRVEDWSVIIPHLPSAAATMQAYTEGGRPPAKSRASPTTLDGHLSIIFMPSHHAIHHRPTENNKRHWCNHRAALFAQVNQKMRLLTRGGEKWLHHITCDARERFFLFPRTHAGSAELLSLFVSFCKSYARRNRFRACSNNQLLNNSSLQRNAFNLGM